ncbi:MAG: Tim44-like domain-containing protein [Burkholderiaceae bacterium]
MKFWTLILALAMAVFSMQADAARLGGGRSMGRQSGNVMKREAAPAPVAPSQAATQSANTAGAAAAGKRPWGAMLGGLAAGLGLVWLAHSLGFGEAFGQILMLAVLAMVVIAFVGWIRRSRRQEQGGAPFAFQGAGGAPVSQPRPYRPENVGNDASARPWERSSGMGLEPLGTARTSDSMIGSALNGPQGWGIPSGFDTDGFLNAAKTNFVTLQAAWDKSDIGALRAMMTDEMLREIKTQLAEREAHTGGPVNHTDVVMIDAKLLGIEDVGGDYMASVEFSGMIREQLSAGPSPFREVWNMTKPKLGASGWLVAGVQALQ